MNELVKHAINSFGWVMKLNSRTTPKGFANMIRRISECPQTFAICEALEEATGTIERNINGTVKYVID